MPRRSKPGYFVHGEFVVRGSAEDQALIAERKGDTTESRTDRKRASQARQDVGESLLQLKPATWQTLDLPETLIDALRTMQQLSDFGARKRQLQYIGKLMRGLDDDAMARIAAHTQAQARGHGQEVAKLHAAEQWRERLLQDDQAVTEWMAAYPHTDVQWLRQTVRAAREHLDGHLPAHRCAVVAPNGARGAGAPAPRQPRTSHASSQGFPRVVCTGA